MSGTRRRHRPSSPRLPVSKIELLIVSVGLVLSVVAGVVAYRIVGLYGDGAFTMGLRHVRDPETGKLMLVREYRTSTGIVRRVGDSEKVTEVQLDVDAAGHEHTRVHLNGTDVAMVERDSNGDGKTDTWEYYDPQKRLVKVGFSLAGDGVLNAWAYRDDAGQIVKVEVSTRHDGVVDRWEYYEKGQLARVDEDTDHDGRVDRRSKYEGGILIDTTTDITGLRRPDLSPR